MLGRRTPRPLFRRFREAVWPTAGWRRSTRYVVHRVKRLPGSAYSIAAGFAAGAAVSFTPFIGFHFVLAALIAWMIGGNVIASAIGTAVGNPWTFPFIWFWILNLGKLLLGDGGFESMVPTELMSMDHIFAHPWEILLPMMVGGLPTALVAWGLFYWPTFRAVRGYKKAREQLRRRHAARRERQALKASAKLAKRAAAAGKDGGAEESKGCAPLRVGGREEQS